MRARSCTALYILEVGTVAALTPAPAIASAAAESITRCIFSEDKMSPVCSPRALSEAICNASCAPPVNASSAVSLPISPSALRTPLSGTFCSSLLAARRRIPPTGPATSNAPLASAVIAVTSPVSYRYAAIASSCCSGGRFAVLSNMVLILCSIPCCPAKTEPIPAAVANPAGGPPTAVAPVVAAISAVNCGSAEAKLYDA